MVASLKVNTDVNFEKDTWRIQHFELKKDIVGSHSKVSQIKAACEVIGHGEIAVLCRMIDKKERLSKCGVLLFSTSKSEEDCDTLISMNA